MKHLLLLLGVILWRSIAEGNDYCDQLNLWFSPECDTIFKADFTLRKVDLEGGSDSLECLNLNKTTDPPSCGSLQYALSLSGAEGVLTDFVFHLGPGLYRSLNSTEIINSHRVAFIGAGISQTIMVCGVNGNDFPCNSLNFQIKNSTHILVSGISFTGCGPITSPLFVGSSDFVFVDSCSFE